MNASFALNDINFNITGFLNQFLQYTMAMVLQLFMCYPEPQHYPQSNIVDTISALDSTHATSVSYGAASTQPNASSFSTEPADALPRERVHRQRFHAGHHRLVQSGLRAFPSPQTFVLPITSSVHDHSSAIKTAANCDLQPWATPKKPPVPIGCVAQDCHAASKRSAQSSMS